MIDIQLSVSAELKLNYLKKPYIVTMGSFQMAVLLLFNMSESVTYKEILTHTQLHERDLVKQVQSLVDAKLITSSEVIINMCHFNTSVLLLFNMAESYIKEIFFFLSC